MDTQTAQHALDALNTAFWAGFWVGALIGGAAVVAFAMWRWRA